MNDTLTVADQLRAAADLIDAHPDLPLPLVWGYRSGVQVQWQLMNDDEVKDSQRVAAAAIRRALGGTWSKDGSTDTFDMRCSLEGLALQILADREHVCERIVTGVETVTIPAVEARPERTEEREVVEWRCEPVLGDRQDEAAVA